MHPPLPTIQEVLGEAPNGTSFAITRAPAPLLDATNLPIGVVVRAWCAVGCGAWCGAMGRGGGGLGVVGGCMRCCVVDGAVLWMVLWSVHVGLPGWIV